MNLDSWYSVAYVNKEQSYFATGRVKKRYQSVNHDYVITSFAVVRRIQPQDQPQVVLLRWFS